MVAIRLQDFGGMIPARDDRLLPENMSALSRNAWLYNGTIEGIASPRSVHTLTNVKARRVYRLPIQYYDRQHIPDSFWMEFENPDTNVIHSPVVQDQFERYYWASGQGFNQLPPYYNTKERILGGYAPYRLGVPAPNVAPAISRLKGAYKMSAASLGYNVFGNDAKLYERLRVALDAETFENGWGKVTTDPVTTYEVNGQRAKLGYGTSIAGNRMVVDDQGNVTRGIPVEPVVNTPTETPEGEGVLETRAYVYTWETAYGEEGPPSPPTVYTGWSDDPWVIKVTAPGSSVTTNRNITKVNIYRTLTGTSGSTTYYLVKTLDISETSFEDRVKDDVVAGNAILESTFWSAPPSDLEGMIMMPNGIIAGWRQNEVWFCEPYRPHAWPTQYTISVEYPIVGLGVIGQTLIACTTGFPYAISGINPANMAISRIATYEPCVSRGSIVSTQEGVIFASQNGLVMAQAGVAQNATANLITTDIWPDLLYLPSLRATRVNNAYFCWGSVLSGCFEPTAFDNDNFLLDDYSGAYTGAMIDIANPRISFVELYNAAPTFNLFADHWTGETLLIRDGKVMWLDLTADNHEPYIWRSKIIDMPNKRNLEAMRIYFSPLPDSPTLNPTPNASLNQTLAPDQYGLVRVYAEDRLVFTRELRSSGEFMRLPSGFKATWWQIEVEGRVKIYSIETATAAKELAGA